MNLTFIIKGGTATERHMTEHMFLIRTKNYTESRSLEEYVRSTLNEKDFDNFRSYHDYTECTFFNLKPEIVNTIKSELETWYFTKEDFDFEKRILEIEYANLDYKLIKIEKQALGLTQEITNIKEIQPMTFEKLLNIKNNKLEIFEWSDEVKNLSNFNLTQKNFKIKSKKVTSFIKHKYICFELESNPILFDLANILNYILFNKYNDNSACFEHIVLGRSAIAIRYSRFLGYFQYYLIKLAINEWFESVIALYKEESSKNSSKVRRSLTDSINIFEFMDNGQIKQSLYNLLELMQKYEKEN